MEEHVREARKESGMPTNSSHVRTRLLGGYGNQLFSLAAGFQTAEFNQLDLVIDTSAVGQGRTNHGVVLPLNGAMVVHRNGLRGRFFEFVELSVRKIRREFKRLAALTFWYPKTFESKVLGFNADLLDAREPIRIFGYFQSHIYFDLIQDKARFLDLITPQNFSDWYLEELRGLEKDNPIVLHVRRGDYVKERDSFGLLSDRYYVNAVEALGNLARTRKIWIYSDDPYAARELLEGAFADFEILFRHSPTSVDPLETLLIMSRAQYLIIANSSFSWWAAALGQGKNLVVAPAPWFRTMAEPEKLRPEHWITCESDWI